MVFRRKNKKQDRFHVEEHKLQLFVDALPVPAGLKSADGFVVTNQDYRALLDTSEAPDRGQSNASPVPDAVEDRILRSDGKIIPCRLKSRDVFTDKEAKLSLVTVEDITRERELQDVVGQVLSALTVATAASRVLIDHRGADDLIRRLLRAMCESSPWQAAAFWTLDTDINRLRCLEFCETPGDSARFPRFAEHCRQFACEPGGAALPSLVWKRQAVVWVEEIDSDEGSIRELKAGNEGLRSSVGVPVMTDGAFRGVIELLSVNPMRREEQIESLLLGIVENFDVALRQLAANEELREQAERVHAMAELSKDAVITIDDEGTILSVNSAAERLFGYRRDELMGHNLTMLMPESLRQSHLDGLRRYRETGRRRMQWDAIELPALLRNGEEILVELAFAEGRSHGKRIFTGFMRDVTRRKKDETALVQVALHDSLSGLPNRNLLQERIQRSILVGQRHGQPLSLMIMDLDRFKEVNETFGHQQGDQLLTQVANRLTSTMRESDTVARLGGDEFAVLLPGTSEQGALLAADRMLKSLALPFTIEGQDLDISGSIGIAVFPDHGRDLSTLLRAAEAAMYEAKREESGYGVYQGGREEADSRVLMKAELRQAIENDQLILHYQPKIDLKAGRTRQVEALVRWPHPERGMIPPDAFITLADESGMMRSLTLWVLNEALRQRKEWEEAGVDLKVAVNFSARTLDMELVQGVEQLLETWETDSGYLGVEVTESAVMKDPARSLQTLTALHDMGVTISIDDFGTGQSSFTYLKQLPVDEIKIDKSFVLKMSSDRDDLKIVEAVVNLGHKFDLKVVAEGVENKRSIDLLKGMGCDMAQGFFISKPLPAADLSEWLSAQEVPELSAS